MHYTEGSVRISRSSLATEPEPWKYEISFTPYAASGYPPACDVVGDEQLKRALCFALGLSEPNLGDSVRTARHVAVVIHHVALTDRLKTLLDTEHRAAAHLAAGGIRNRHSHENSSAAARS
jgi:hypothetical protein